MEIGKIIEHYQDVFENIDSYALIHEDDNYAIFDVSNQSFLLAEYDHSDLVKLLLERCVKVVSSYDEVKDPDFIRYVSIWDEEKNDWIQIPESDIDKYRNK